MADTNIRENSGYVRKSQGGKLSTGTTTDDFVIQEWKFEALCDFEIYDTVNITQAVILANFLTSINDDGNGLEAKSSITGKRGKCVRFADECGFSLETVRMVPSDSSECPPQWNWNWKELVELELPDGIGKSLWNWSSPIELEAGECEQCALNRNAKTFDQRSSTSQLPFAQDNSSENASVVKRHNTDKKPVWTTQFRQPASDYIQLRDILKYQKVALENVMFKDQAGRSRMLGTIKVSNIAYEKRIFLRITHDGWKTFIDHAAVYQSSPSRHFDIFEFDVELPKPQKSQRNQPRQQRSGPLIKVEFCVSFIAGENGSRGHYWDSNGGRNFLVTLSFPSPLFLGHST